MIQEGLHTDVYFAEYRVAVLFGVMESAGITPTVFRNAFAEQHSSIVKKSELFLVKSFKKSFFLVFSVNAFGFGYREKPSE